MIYITNTKKAELKFFLTSSINRYSCLITVHCRPSLADKQKVGFFSLDVASQTDQTEIFNIKHLTNVVQALLTVIHPSYLGPFAHREHGPSRKLLHCKLFCAIFVSALHI